MRQQSHARIAQVLERQFAETVAARPEVLATQGQHAAGMAKLQRGIAAWRALGSEGTHPWVLGLLAEACFHRALDLARQQQARAWELRAAMSLARLWQQ
jgi:hypothetical protein